MKVKNVVWVVCRRCEAPLVRPLPEGWSYTVKKHRNGKSKVMPHEADCPDGFAKVELPE